MAVCDRELSDVSSGDRRGRHGLRRLVDGSLYALDPATGAQLWRDYVGGVYNLAIGGDGTLYASTDWGFYCHRSRARRNRR